MQKYNILELNEKLLPELQSIAEELGVKKAGSLRKEELVYRILDEQAISYAGIHAEKEKEKEAKKGERVTKVKKPTKAAPKAPKEETKEKPVVSTTTAEPVAKPAVESKEQPERKKRVRIEKKEKVAGAVAPANETEEVIVSKTPVTTSVVSVNEPAPVVQEVLAVEAPAEKPAVKKIIKKIDRTEKPLLPPVVAETGTEELPVEVAPAVTAEPALPAAPEATTGSSEDEPKRVVFRHPDTKSVLDQLFPFSSTPAKPEAKAQQTQALASAQAEPVSPQANPRQNNASRQNNQNAHNTNNPRNNQANANAPQEKLYEFDGILVGNGVLEMMPDGYGFLRSSDYNYLKIGRAHV